MTESSKANPAIADKLSQRLAHISGLRAGQNYRIWVEERETFKWFVRYIYAECQDEQIKDSAGELIKYFKKYQIAE